MRNAICQAQRAAPRAAKDKPFVDTELLAKCLDVFNQVPGRIFSKLCVRCRLAGTSLIEQDHVIGLRIEKLSIHRDQAAPRAAVEKDNRYPVWISDAFVMIVVNLRNLQHARIKGLDLRVEWSHKSDNTRMSLYAEALVNNGVTRSRN